MSQTGEILSRAPPAVGSAWWGDLEKSLAPKPGPTEGPMHRKALSASPVDCQRSAKTKLSLLSQGNEGQSSSRFGVPFKVPAITNTFADFPQRAPLSFQFLG